MNHLYIWLLPLIGLPIVGYIIPKIINALAGLFVAQILKDPDQADRELALAVVRWAETRIIKADSGGDKFAIVDHALSKMIPWLPADKRKDLIELSVKAMKNSILKAEQQIKNKTPPANIDGGV